MIAVGRVVQRLGRDDVEHGDAAHSSGMVERHAVGDAPAAVVPGDGEAVMAKLRHDTDEVGRHRPFRVGAVVRIAAGLAEFAVAAQVGGDDGEAFGQRGSDLVPHDVRLRVAVDQQQRRAAAAGPIGDLDAGRVEAMRGEIVEHRDLPSGRTSDRCRGTP